MKKGDLIATVAKPMAKYVIDPIFGTSLQSCGGCNSMQANLNAGMSLADAIYDRFWRKYEKGEEMEFIVIKQIRVEAESIEDAFAKAKDGTVVQMTISQRPEAVMAPASARPSTLPMQMPPGTKV